MPPIMWFRRQLRALEMWIDDALGRAARCRLSALGQRSVTAGDVVPRYAVDLQADRIIRVVRLGLRWCRSQNCWGRQNRESRNAHQSILWGQARCRTLSRERFIEPAKSSSLGNVIFGSTANTVELVQKEFPMAS
jgi:hypothetical protein